jgi:predicted transposase/invertase (TIGR01784 family)
MYNPKYDFIFKKIFFIDNNKDILIGLINSFLREDQKIKDVILKNTDNSIENALDKNSYLDIKAIDNNNNLVIIEMQVARQDFFEQRVLYYWSRTFTNQLIKSKKKDKSKNYKALHRVVSLNILDFILDDKDARYHTCYEILERESHKPYKDNYLEIHFLELPKVAQSSEELTDWSKFFKLEDLENITKKNKLIKKAYNQLMLLNLTPAELETYEKLEKHRMDTIGQLEYAEQEGIKKGLKEGEHKKAVETAKKLLKRGLSIEDIAEDTGLSIKELNSLKD